MSWHPTHKQSSRQRILEAAGELFSKQGFDQVGINEVMQAAGMTRGAFYSHFESKSQLYSEAIRAMAQRQARYLAAEQPSMEQMLQSYLSMEHRNGEPFQCPLAFLISDAAQREEQVRTAWTETFRGFSQLIERTQSHDIPIETATDNIASQQAMQTAVMMIGGLAIARALNDDVLAQALLTACRNSPQGAGKDRG